MFLLLFYWGSGPSLPTILKLSIVTWLPLMLLMVKDLGGCLLMFFEPLCKSSRWFTNVFLITVNPATIKSIDDPTLFEDWILILGGHQEAFDGFSSFKIHLYAMFVTGLFEALTDTLMIGYHHVGLLALVVVVVGISFLFCVLVFLGLWSYLGPIQCPFWILAIGECLVKVLLFLLQKFRAGTNLAEPCGGGYLPHHTWMLKYGCCPTAGIGLYV